MRVCARLTGLLLILNVPVVALGATPGPVSATIQATAKVVPPVGVETVSESDEIDLPAQSSLYWVHAPRPDNMYVTLTDHSGEAVCLPSGPLTVLERHRYRELICVTSPEATEPLDRSYVLTVISTGD